MGILGSPKSRATPNSESGKSETTLPARTDGRKEPSMQDPGLRDGSTVAQMHTWAQHQRGYGATTCALSGNPGPDTPCGNSLGDKGMQPRSHSRQTRRGGAEAPQFTMAHTTHLRPQDLRVTSSLLPAKELTVRLSRHSKSRLGPGKATLKSGG